MKVSALSQEFKYYALHEVNMKPASHKLIEKSMRWLCDYSKTENLKDLTTAVVRAYLLNGSVEKGWSPKTFRNYRQNISSFFGWAKSMKYVDFNPTAEIKKPKLPKPTPRALSHEQAKAVLYYSYWHPWDTEWGRVRNEMIIMTFLLTGIRRQELLDLKVQDVNLHDLSVFIEEGKGDKDRYVPIHHKLLPKLRTYIETKEKYGQPSPWFFTGLKSDIKLQARDIRTICKLVGETAKVKFTPHMLRHTFGREMAERDFPMHKLQKVMGHSSIETTMIYANMVQVDVKDAFQKIEMY